MRTVTNNQSTQLNLPSADRNGRGNSAKSLQEGPRPSSFTTADEAFRVSHFVKYDMTQRPPPLPPPHPPIHRRVCMIATFGFADVRYHSALIPYVDLCLCRLLRRWRSQMGNCGREGSVNRIRKLNQSKKDSESRLLVQGTVDQWRITSCFLQIYKYRTNIQKNFTDPYSSVCEEFHCETMKTNYIAKLIIVCCESSFILFPRYEISKVVWVLRFISKYSNTSMTFLKA